MVYAAAGDVPARPHLTSAGWVRAADPGEAGRCGLHLRLYRESRAAALARLVEAPPERERWWDAEADA